MRSKNRPFSIASMCCVVAIMALITVPVHSALDDDNAPATSLDQVVSKVTKKKKSAATKPAAVNSSDLMKAMQQTLQAAPAVPAPVQAAPAANTTLPTAAPQAAAPIVDQPTKIVAPVKKDSYVAPEGPAETPAATPHEGGVVMYEQQNGEGKAVSPSSATSDEKPAEAAAVPDKETTAKDETAKDDKAQAAPSSSAAPLLSDMQEAPTVLGGSAPVVAPASDEKKPLIAPATAPAKMESAPDDAQAGYSKPRSLFSAPGKKRKGVKANAAPAETRAVAPAPTPEPTSLPPVTPPPAKDSQAIPAPSNDGEMAAPPQSADSAQKPSDEQSSTEKKIIEPGETPSEPLIKAEGNDEGAAAPDASPPEKPEAETQEKALEKPVGSPPEAVTVEWNSERAAVTPPETMIAPAAAMPATASAVSLEAGAVQGSCGAINGIGATGKPTINLCTQGTPTEVTGEGPWSWNCVGANGGGTASCAAPLQVNGDCGMANGSQSATTPIGGLCKTGKASEVSGTGPWYWNCFGDNGGVVAQCVAYTLVSGRCGAANGVAVSTAPNNALCNAGKETAVTGNGPWMWNCLGTGEGQSVNCMAPLLQAGLCGTASTTGSAIQPVSGLCAAGTPTPVAGNGPWSWSCMGEGGAASANCTAKVLTSGACGPSHGLGMADKPQTGLCATGAPSDVSGDGPWNWTCYGENGGAKVNCMAPRKVDGVCGPSHLTGANMAPATGLCATGEASPVIGSGPWQWSCAGAGGGITANCVANPAVNAACGAAHGVSTTQAPAGDLCASGNATTVIGSGPWMWTCEGEHGGSPVNCMAPMQVNGACGPADKAPSVAAPTANLCRTGAPTSVSGNGPWTWNCQGAGGGISVPCQSPVQTAAQAAAAAPAETAATAQVPDSTNTAGNECTPSVKRWTITCQQGGYPANYTGVIVGETQVLCPMNVERGVWLSNSCAPATNSSPVSPSPGVLVTPPSPKLPANVTDMLPDIQPLPSKALEKPRAGLATPRFRDAGGEVGTTYAAPGAPRSDTVAFAAASEALDAQAVSTLGAVADSLQGDTRSIITLNSYAAMPANNDQQEARRVALARALAVRSYLMRKGISSNRIDIRALGPAGDGRSDDRVDISVK